MSKFLQRNKRKGLVGLLLLLFQQRKVLVALLLVSVMLSFVFIAPSNFMGGAFGASRTGAAISWVAARLGLGGVFGTGQRVSFAGVLAAFRAAKDGRDLSWSAVFGRGAVGAPADSSLGMVRGDASEYGLTTAARGAARTISGILTREDAGKDGEGVTLDDEDLAGERAGEYGGIATVGADGRGPNQTAGPNAWASKGFFEGSGGGRDDAVTSALYNTSVPRTGGGKMLAGTAGKLSNMKVAKASAERRAALNMRVSKAKSGAMHQLAQGRARAMMARDPNCTASNGCPAEYAATNSGAVYDGNLIGPGAPEVITAPQIDGSAPVSVPSDGLMQGYLDEAQQAEEDAKKCKAADAQYTPEEQRLSAKIQEHANKLNAMSCGGGGCSKSKAAKCKAEGNRMKQTCAEYYAVQCQHIMACPFTAPDGCPTPDCNR